MRTAEDQASALEAFLIHTFAAALSYVLNDLPPNILMPKVHPK
jgi:hypothetical protein